VPDELLLQVVNECGRHAGYGQQTVDGTLQQVPNQSDSRALQHRTQLQGQPKVNNLLIRPVVKVGRHDTLSLRKPFYEAARQIWINIHYDRYSNLDDKAILRIGRSAGPICHADEYP
jgi:hypothetical protein